MLEIQRTVCLPTLCFFLPALHPPHARAVKIRKLKRTTKTDSYHMHTQSTIVWKLNVNNCSLQTFWTAQNFYWLWWITLIIKYCEDSNLCKALLQQIQQFQFTFIQKLKSSHFLFVQNCLSGTWILRSMLIFSKCFVTQYEQFLWHSSNYFINYFFLASFMQMFCLLLITGCQCQPYKSHHSLSV